MPESTAGGADAPPTNAKYVIDDSPLKASVVTCLSLLFFGITLAGAVLRMATAGDLNGIRALLMRDDVIGWITTIITTLGPVLWAIYRSLKSWFNKIRDVEIAKAAPNAMLKSEIAPMPATIVEPSSSRAPETKTRLVGIESLAPMTAVPMPPVAPPKPDAPDPAAAARGENERLIDGKWVKISRDPAPAPDIPGDALNMPGVHSAPAGDLGTPPTDGSAVKKDS